MCGLAVKILSYILHIASLMLVVLSKGYYAIVYIILELLVVSTESLSL